MKINNVEQLELSELDKFSKIKRIGKKCLLGVLAVGLTLSLAPSAEFYYTKITSNIETEIPTDNESRIQFIKELYVKGINENNKLSDEEKEQLINSFCNYVIEPYGLTFTDEAIIKMYVSAKTESIEYISSFISDHGWWAGDYNPVLNKLAYDGEDITLAHEQVHAMVKNGIINSGFTELSFGYGINEGCTAMLVSDDPSYSDVVFFCQCLGLIIGFDNLMECYFSSDLNRLIEIMEQYVTKEEATKFIELLDKEVYSGYYHTFLQKNDLDWKSEEEFEEEQADRFEQIGRILHDMCEAKTGVPVAESQLGKLLSLARLESFPDYDDSPYLGSIDYAGHDEVSICLHYPLTAIVQSETGTYEVERRNMMTFELTLEEIENGDFSVETMANETRASNDVKTM